MPWVCAPAVAPQRALAASAQTPSRRALGRKEVKERAGFMVWVSVHTVAQAVGLHPLAVRIELPPGVNVQILQQIRQPRNRANLQAELALHVLHGTVRHLKYCEQKNAEGAAPR